MTAMDEMQVGAGTPSQEHGWGNFRKDLGKQAEEEYERKFSQKRMLTVSRPLIIGFGHEAQQGKDTAVNHLVQTFNRFPEFTVTRYSFADALKVEAFDWLQGLRFATLNGLAQPSFPTLTGFINKDPQYLPMPGIYPQLTSRVEKLTWVNTHKNELRPFLQKWGTEFRRYQSPNYWVDQTLKQIAAERPQVALLSDMRFKNEAGICDYTVRVIREGHPDPTAGKVHASEIELDNYSYHFVLSAPSGNVEVLKGAVNVVFEKILKLKGLL